LDYRRQGAGADPASKLSRWSDVPLEKTYTDRELDLASREACGDLYAKMAQPCYTAAKQIGNAYTASIYINLATLVASQGVALSGKRALMFSYGSGCMSTMFAIHGRDATDPRFSLTAMAEKLQITERLKERVGVSAAEYEQFMNQRERFHGQHSVTPAQSLEWVFDGAYYLEAIDAQFRRTYARKTRETVETLVNGTAAAVAESSAACAYVSGVSALLPGRHHADDRSPLDALLRGDNCIEKLRDEAVDAMLERNIVQLKRSSPRHVERFRVASRSDSIQLAALAPSVDLTAAPYHLPSSMVDAMDEPTQLGVAAGLNAMRDAGLVGTQNGHATASDWQLAPALASSTGVIYATSFPTMHATAAEIARFHDASSAYELDRKLLFRLLVLANAQLAQITGARGPNTQMNAACAGMTQAIAMARDWLALRKCDRVVVVASDVASSETLLPLIGSGFRVLGAASTAPTVEQAARPFDAQRNGMIVGSGAAALVLEAPAQGPIGSAVRGPRVVRLLAARYANSAFHGASIGVDHVTQELRALFEEMETVHGITRAQFVAHGVYYSHETFTNASPTSSCAFAEVSALRGALGDDALVEQLLITNTKGFTAHAMGVSFEDVAAVEGLRRGVVPPVVHFESHDLHLGVKLRLARGGAHPHKYALRFAAGFGSQVALTLYALEEK
jgi:3-oxoacyl-(acyl-carrier-protein) synthase